MEILNVTEQIINVNATDEIINVNVVEEIIDINVTEAVVNVLTQTGAYPLPSDVISVFGRVGNVVGQAGDYTTSIVAEGSNLYYTQARFDTAFGNKSTTNLTEGSNLYYTDARSRSAISENITGLEYSSASGIFSLTAGYLIPTQAMLDAKQDDLNGTGIVKSTSGTISYLTDNTANWDAAYNDKINSASVTGTSTKTLTLNQQDGGTITASWTDENTGGVTSVFGRTGAVVAVSGDYNTSQVTENTNLYYTQARFDTAFGNKSTTNLTEGTNLYYTDARSRAAISETITGIDYNNVSGVFSLASGYVIPTQAALDAKQDDLNGTGIVKSTGGTISYLTDNTANWDAAYNDKINSASVSGTTTKTLTLNQQDGGTITASWTDENTDAVTSVFGRTGVVIATEGDYTLTQLGDVTLTSPANGQVLKYNGTAWVNGTDTDTGLTSVGLSMPAAFSVSGSPLTSNGVISVTAAGLASQYVRGDGALADFPTTTGGGSSVSYYLNSSISQGTIGGVAYRELSKEPIIGAGTDITISANGYVASYITDANDPSLLEVPGGNFNCEFYFSVNSNNHNPFVYAELYKYNGTTFTLLGSSQAIPEYLTSGTNLHPYYFAIPVATAALSLTDRIALRIYVNVDTRVVTLHTENSHLCQVVTTFSKGMTSLNNLTNQVQYLATGTSGSDFNILSATDTHTFNLPTASATNTGKLSASDWSVFNAKQPLITAGTTAQYYRGDKTFQTLDTLAVPENTNLYYTEGRVSANTDVAANTAARHAAVTIGTANGLSLSTQALSLALASTSTTGALSSTDFTTFNNKANALSGTINTIAYWDSSSTIASLALATYPSLTELSYVKGVTSAIQTQLNAKQGTLTLTTTGTSGAATLIGDTLNIPQYSGGGGGGMAIGGSITSATAGSVLFAGASGVLAQDNANFFWDDTNDRLNIGSSTTGVFGSSLFVSQKSTNYAFEIKTTSAKTSTTLNKFMALSSSDATSPHYLEIGIVGNATIGSRYFSFQTSEFLVADGGNIVFQPRGGNVAIGATTIGSKFQINGNAAIGYSASTAAPTNGLQVAGQSLFGDNIQLNKGQNGRTEIRIVNETAGTSSRSALLFFSNTASGSAEIFKYSSSITPYKNIGASALGIYNNTAGNISILNDIGNINFSAGGSSSATLILDTSNNLGLNTSTIGSRLQVNGNVAIGYSASTAAPTNGLQVSGRVYFGLGQIGSQTELLQIKAAEATIAIQTTTATSYSGVNLYDAVGTLAASFQYGNASAGTLPNTFFFGPRNATASMAFVRGVGATESARIDSSGNFAINTTTIGSRLQVNGNAAIGYSASTAAPTNGLAVSGQVGVGTNAPVTTAALQISSTTQGFLPPVMTTTQKNAITSPATGLVVFDSTLGKLCVFSGTWQTITSA
jgi:hypothetical protein